MNSLYCSNNFTTHKLSVFELTVLKQLDFVLLHLLYSKKMV
jgi:hypothetical protein